MVCSKRDNVVVVYALRIERIGKLSQLLMAGY